MIESQSGTPEQALELQQANNVPEAYRGPWHHGTRNASFSCFRSDRGTNGTGWLTRSPTGGKAWGNHVAVFYVVSPVSDRSPLTDAQAGDADGMDPERPGKYRTNWWLKVDRGDLNSLMFVGIGELGT